MQRNAPSRSATPSATDPALERDIAAVCAFTRFDTRLTGVLQEGLLDSPFSLAEVSCPLRAGARRGLNGRRLVRECLTFARDTGCRTVMLWTNATLAAARAIYEAEGFTLVAEEAHELFGPTEMGQTWELAL